MIHLVYPHDKKISCPDAIGRNLGLHLQERYEVTYHGWDDQKAIVPKPGDVLIGHANPSPFTCFRMSMKQPGWKRIILMLPHSHGNPTYNAFVDSFIEKCDLFLAITGNYWFDTLRQSPFAHWAPKMRHLDLAVDRQDFPPLKERFNPPGQRRFVFIGKSSHIKNIRYLSHIARRLLPGSLGWIGRGRPIQGVSAHGYCDFSTEEGRSFVSQYDFLITVGRSDANPATILEAMAWGLIPVCSPQSGYVGYPGIVNIPVDDLEKALDVLNNLQTAPERELLQLQAENWRILDEHFCWPRFARQVAEAIESDESPVVDPVSRRHYLWLNYLSLLAPYATWRRPRHLRRVVAFYLKRMLSGG
jgi:glycosyltransferase involved in cell wall biosynthesis